MRDVNNYTINEQGDSLPWGAREAANFELLFNMMPTRGTFLVDAVTVPTPHLHRRLYDENSALQAEMSSTGFAVTQPMSVRASAIAGIPGDLAGTSFATERNGDNYFTMRTNAANKAGFVISKVGDNDGSSLIFDLATNVWTIKNNTYDMATVGLTQNLLPTAHGTANVFRGFHTHIAINGYQSGLILLRDRAELDGPAIKDAFSIIAFVFGPGDVDAHFAVTAGTGYTALSVDATSIILTFNSPGSAAEMAHYTWHIIGNTWSENP